MSRRAPSASRAGLRLETAIGDLRVAEVARILQRRWRVSALALAAVLVGTVVATAATPVQHTASSTFIPLDERDVILQIMEGRDFRRTVVSLGDLAWLGDGDADAAAGALAEHVRALPLPRSQVPPSVVEVRATFSDPDVAVRVADAYVAALAQGRGELENVTRARHWDRFVQDAGGDTELAEARMEAYLAKKEYFVALDPASARPIETTPSWGLNLAVGGAFGLLAAFLLPFLLEGAARLRQDLSRGDAPP